MSIPQHITKLEAAKRQLSEAIWLFFEDRDPICVLALAGGARRVLIDLAEKQGMRTVRDDFRDIIVPGHEKEAERLVNHAQNFIKHANLDPDDTLDPERIDVESVIFEACVTYLPLAKEWLVEIAAFMAWMQLEFPQFFKADLIDQQAIKSVKGDKQYFLGFLQRAEAATHPFAKLGRKSVEF